MPLARPDQNPDAVRHRLGRLFNPPPAPAASQEPESSPQAAAPPAPDSALPAPERPTAPPDDAPSRDLAGSDDAGSSEDPVGAAPPTMPPTPPGPVSDARRFGERITEAFGVRGARVDPGRAGFRALAALAAVAVVVAALVAWRQSPEPESVTPSREASSTAQPSPSPSGVVVSVAGRVRRPGLVTLRPGARVADAIEAAGGLLPGTDVGYLNLARKVSDGEMIVVGVTPPPGAVPGAGGPERPGDPAGKVNLNAASAAQLETLPGVGPVLAQNIIDYRDEHGGFRSVGQLRQVTGIGPARYKQLQDLVTV